MLERYLAKAQAPTLDPSAKFSLLILCTMTFYVEVDVAPWSSIAPRGASAQENPRHTKSFDIKLVGKCLGEALTPSPVHGRRWRPPTEELSLFPLQVFLKSAGDTPKKLGFIWNECKVVIRHAVTMQTHKDASYLDVPETYRLRDAFSVRCEPWANIRSAKVFDAGARRFRVLPSRGEFPQDLREYCYRSMSTLVDDSINSVETAKLLGPFM